MPVGPSLTAHIMADFQHGMLVPNTVTHWVCGRLPTGYAGVLPAHTVCVARLPARCAGVKTFTRCNVNATGFKHADFDHLDLYIRRLCVPLNLLFTCIVQRKKLFQFQYWKFAITEHLRFWISRMSGKNISPRGTNFIITLNFLSEFEKKNKNLQTNRNAIFHLKLQSRPQDGDVKQRSVPDVNNKIWNSWAEDEHDDEQARAELEVDSEQQHETAKWPAASGLRSSVAWSECYTILKLGLKLFVFKINFQKNKNFQCPTVTLFSYVSFYMSYSIRCETIEHGSY